MKAFLFSWIVNLAMLGLVVAPTAFGQTPSPSNEPHPLMWVIKDGPTTVYFFGSIHVMKDGVDWFTPRIAERFATADTLWLEVPNLDDMAGVNQIAQKYMLDPSQEMTKGLSTAEVSHIDAIAKPYGLSVQQLQGMRKWAVGLYLETRQIAALGYEAKRGVDITLLAKARAANMTIHGFETMDQQMQYLSPHNESEDKSDLLDTLKDIDTDATDLPVLLKAWETGNEPILDHYLIGRMKTEDPSQYQHLIVDRNHAWEPLIEALMKDETKKGGGTIFIAVGTAHLIGPESVLALLKSRGWMAQPVN